MLNRPPAFQFYPKDWLDFRVQRMSLAAQGAYLKILCFMWADSADQCSIPDDNEQLARAIGLSVEQWMEIRREIQRELDPILEEKDSRLVSGRLKQEARKQRHYRKLQAEKGKRSAQQRFNRSSTVVQPMYQPEGNSSSSSSELKKKNTPASRSDVLNGHQASFELFWSHFPKKRGKGQAEKVWAKLQPDDVLLGEMLGKLEQAKQSPDWMKNSGQFIPHPATWLNGKGWEDEYHAVIPRKERIPL